MDKNNPVKYDLCVIGCGTSGFAAAMRAFDLGKNVCIIENEEIGGAGVRWGALASKTLWELSKDFAVASKTDRGYRADKLILDYSDVRKTTLEAVKEKQYQMLSQIETFFPSAEKGAGSIILKKGCASFISRNRIKILSDSDIECIITAEKILIATGSKPRSFAGIEFDHKKIFNSDSILNLSDFPKKLMIVGAGIVGCEYATIFSNFGRTKVYLVDHEKTVIPYEDSDISDFVCSSLENNGVEIFHSAVLKAIKTHLDHLDVFLEFEDGHCHVCEVDAVLISIGREPNLSCLNIENANITPDKSGRISTDHDCKAADNIFAAGDVTHLPALVNIAEMEGRHAVMAMFDKPFKPLSYKDMSTIMFFNPPVAAVGMNEKMCRKKKIPYRAAYYSNSLLARSIAMRSLNGFVKIISTDEKKPKILGMRAAGPQVSSTIMAVALFMNQSGEIRDMLNTLYPHPTMSEGIQECIRLLLGESVFKPYAFPEKLKMWSWNPD